jgi:hypothetical protein
VQLYNQIDQRCYSAICLAYAAVLCENVHHQSRS